MTESPDDVQRLDPDRLIYGFRRIKIFVIGLAIALGFHLLVIGATSIDTIARLVAPPPAVETAAPPETGAESPGARTRGAPTAPGPAAPKASTAADGTENVPEGLRDHPVVREATGRAQAGEVPPEPTPGLSIDETTGPAGETP